MAGDFPLAPERPVTLEADGVRLATLMCTPFDLDELAVGHLLSRGALDSRLDLVSLFVCPDRGSVRVETRGGRGATIAPEGLLASACGAGGLAAPLPAASAEPRGFDPGGEALFSLEDLKALSRRMFESAVLYRETGGVHVAAIAGYAGEGGSPWTPSLFHAREDVGRHNAVDKVLGRGLLDGIDFSRCVLLTSGRIAADMVLKSARAGVPVLVSRSIPTTEAHSLALAAGLTLIGRIGAANPIVYTLPERIRKE